jgi:hypothetical protein
MDKSNILLVVLAISMFAALVMLDRIEEPLKEIAQLPKCEGNDVILTEDFMSAIKNFASTYIENGTGNQYFNSHFQYLETTYSTIECTFVVKYSYTYEELHQVMSITIHAISPTKYDVTQTNTFLRPVNVLVTKDQAEQIAKQQNVSYDYYNKEIIIPDQTIVYRFYKESAPSTVLVLEIDAISQQIVKIEQPKAFTPIV